MGMTPKKTGAGTKVPTTPKFKSNITRLADNVFTFGTVQDAANYDDTKNHIVRYIATQDFSGAAVAAQVVATLVDPSSSQPVPPEEEHMVKQEDGSEKSTPKSAHKLAVELEMWKADYNDWNKNEKTWKENKSKVYHLILCQCPPELLEHLKSIELWDKTSSELNVVNLLHMIRAVCLKHDETKQGIMSAVNSDIRFYTFRQSKDMSCDEYLKLFRAQVDTINAHGGRAGFHWGTYQAKVAEILARDGKQDTPSDRELMDRVEKEASDLACTEYLACMFIRAADQARYGGLKTALDNQFLLSDEDKYPKTLSGPSSTSRTTKYQSGTSPSPKRT